ncbi:helix-turn-helix domain-containing protein [Pigmentiphaga litoralis]|uniref:Transcriptional regulator with XRE-family HTH domain n=1 Tax=Pigmentiphaga litoralis TaxID=516702 RepID=A0A7Y9IYE2_9BURK|nr:helix-turn-helix transcriptional regulator [Pigmentiphaga litoralis]NYE25985.1 transcriptional regulator with XRE-family HTH domain [Pigmentiphaga litoralis]NYE85105.1 transcriptional regulator with XRE-family HTH domain [Pigmentiphaga litoralis]
MHIGEALRTIRVRQGRTQESVALDVGFNSANLSRLECGGQGVTLDRLMALAASLKVRASDLVKMIEGPAAIGGVQLQEEEIAYADDIQALCRAYGSLDAHYRMIGLMMIRDLAKAQRTAK